MRDGLGPIPETSGGRLFDAFLSPLERLGLAGFRALAAGGARGRVLELGAGTGANLGFYDGRVVELTVSDLEPGALLRLRMARRGLGEPTSADATALTFPDARFDTVVSTLVFCSVAAVSRAFAEIRRVLRPGGEWRFVEHVLPRERAFARAARTLSPAWRRVAGGCRLDRDTVAAIEAAGFAVEILGVAAAGALVVGRAVPRPGRPGSGDPVLGDPRSFAL